MLRFTPTVLLTASLTLGGCMQTTLSPSSDASMTPRDRQLLAHPPYAQASIPEQFQRHIVDYTRKEQPGSILVDTDARYLYFVLPQGKAIRYGVAVGEEAPIRRALLAARPIHWARVRSISTRATRTRSIASMAPTSPNISGRRSRRAASA